MKLPQQALLVLSLALSSMPATAAEVNLTSKIDGLVDRLAPPESQVGISVVDVATGESLYQRQAQKLFVPASLQKLLTAMAALSLLGPQKRFTTRLLGDMPGAGGGLRGPLYLHGEGDPTLEVSDLEGLAEAVRARGIRTVDTIVADATYFQAEERAGAGWTVDDLPWDYAAPVGALSLHRNAVDLKLAPGRKLGEPLTFALSPATAYIQLRSRALTQAIGTLGGVSLTNGLTPLGTERWDLAGGMPLGAVGETWNRSVSTPSLYTATALKEALQRRGIVVNGSVRLGTVPSSARLLASHASAPLAELVRTMNKESDNLIAETLLFHLGIRANALPGTREKGLKALRAYVEHAGWAPGSYRLEDGCGLSRYDTYTPKQLTALLAKQAAQPSVYAPLLVSLPVSGTDGTLASRLGGQRTRGWLRAKTGTMSSVSNLAGFLDTADGRTLALSLMVNGFVQGPERARKLQDEVIELLANN